MAVALALSAPSARAQLGTSGNVPPQHLFDTSRPTRLDTGLGTMAESGQRHVVARRVHRASRR